MNMTFFWSEFESRIAKYDLLKHPFYQAWTCGELTREDLQMYSAQYYKHINAFPEYLAKLETRLPDGTLRSTIKENREDELGSMSPDGRPHSDLWLDFAEGMGVSKEEVDATIPLPEISQLVDSFENLAAHGQTIEALSAFCAYESQVPRIAKEKALGLKQRYEADTKTCKYFAVHTTADVEHTKVWKHLIENEIDGDARVAESALNAAEKAAQSLWQALDGVEASRPGKQAAQCSSAC
jgi:pyrroloquinoline-quinone synthase